MSEGKGERNGCSCAMLPSSLSRIFPSFDLKMSRKKVEFSKVSIPWDTKRGPIVYSPLPPLPSDWSLDPFTPVQSKQPMLKMDELGLGPLCFVNYDLGFSQLSL
ncbi:hypothetical protein AMTRI_Chr01g130610 [Amborella trichopoda]